MLKITHSENATAAVAYFDTALTQGDYYAAEAPGHWHGLGAARLGLIGTVDRDSFATLMANRDPRTGERLTARTKDNRRPGTDFTFNAPKGVSLLHGLTGDERILATFRQAVRETMREVERDAKTRIRSKGADDDRVTGNIAWAEFLHTTARPIDGIPDPHLHTHAFVINATWDAKEQKWKALQLGDIVAERPYYEAAFHARLAHGMKALGYGIQRKGKYWDIARLPDSLLAAFSRRTQEIEAAAKDMGITDAKQKDGLGKRTRQHKPAKERPRDEIRAEWLARAGAAGRAALADAKQKIPQPDATSARTAMEYAVQSAFERASVATEKSIFATALRRGFGDVLPDTVKAAADTIELVSGTIAGRKVVTMRHILDEETRMIEYARLGRLTSLPLAPAARLATTRLTADQKQAIQHVWRSPDRVMVIRGGAGTGKTTLMAQAVDGIAGNGNRVAVFAPTSAARDVLRAEGFTGAETLQRLLADERLQAHLAKAVLWVDEAGLVSVPDMAKLFELAARLGARVILSGDPGQHSSVIRGDALRLIEARAGIRPASVTEIVRQRGTYKDLVDAIAAGQHARAWGLLDQMQAIVELPGETRLDRLAADYVAETKAQRSVLVVSPTHAEKNRVTAVIRDALTAEGRLTDARPFTVWQDLNWTVAEKSDAARYQPGQWLKLTQQIGTIQRGSKLEVIGADRHHVHGRDRSGTLHLVPLDRAQHFKVYSAHEKEFAVGDLVRITENGQLVTGGKLVNGAVHRIAGFDAVGDIRLDNRKTLPRDYGAFDHGYASTSVAAQGRTVDTVLIAMGEASLPATFAEQFYVTVSRGRETVRLYTDHADAVKSAVTRTGQRGSATELVAQSLDRKLKPEPERQHRLRLYAETLARHMRRAARAARDEPDRDRDLMRAAKQAAIAEYQGRLADLGPELGG